MIWCRINGKKYRCDFQEEKVVLLNEETSEFFFIPKETKVNELSDIIKDMEKL